MPLGMTSFYFDSCKGLAGLSLPIPVSSPFVYFLHQPANELWKGRDHASVSVAWQGAFLELVMLKGL